MLVNKMFRQVILHVGAVEMPFRVLGFVGCTLLPAVQHVHLLLASGSVDDE